MLGYRCGVSHYPQFHYQDLEKFPVLSHPYLGSFEGDNEGKPINKNGC